MLGIRLGGYGQGWATGRGEARGYMGSDRDSVCLIVLYVELEG